MTGVFVLDKPAGMTSFGAVAAARRLFGEKRIGHTGTLDPMATGVLPLLLGRAARAAALLPETEKEYDAAFALGAATDTEDSTGRVTERTDARVSEQALRAALPAFCGDILQIPPMYSAVHRDGRRLYELAREGLVVEREPRPVRVDRLELTSFDAESQTGTLSIRCSKGTYVRTLICDLARACGTLGMMTSLRRTAACGFSLEDAVPLETARGLAESGGARRACAPGGQPLPRSAAGGGERRAGRAVCQRRRARPAAHRAAHGAGRARGTAPALRPGRRVPGPGGGKRRRARRAAAVLPAGGSGRGKGGTRRMKLYHDLHPADRETAVAIGVFDGLHLGHRRVIGAAIGRGVSPAVFTFETDILRDGKRAPVLLTQERKIGLLAEMGVELCWAVPFAAIHEMEARDFARDVLAGVCRATTVCCGYNFRFGRGGLGTAESLTSFGQEFGFRVCVVPARGGGRPAGEQHAHPRADRRGRDRGGKRSAGPPLLLHLPPWCTGGSSAASSASPPSTRASRRALCCRASACTPRSCTWTAKNTTA